MSWKLFFIINAPLYILIFSYAGKNNSWGGIIFGLMWMLCVVIFTIGEVYRERKYR